MKEVRKTRFKDLLTIFLLMCISGNPCVTQVSSFADYIYLMMFGWLIVAYGKHLKFAVCKRIALWTSFLMMVFVIQTYTLQSPFQLTSINYLVKVTVAIFTAYIFGDRFPYLYLKVITYLAAFSLGCFALNFMGVELPALVDLEHRGSSIFLYRQQADISTNLRNSGMFWEPGAFAGYIIFTFILFINSLDVLWKQYGKHLLILILALVTTFSTTGYLVVALITIIYFAQSIKNKVILGFVYVSIAPLLYVAYTEMTFLEEKIMDEYEYAMERDALSLNYSRMGSALIDFYYIGKHPLFGNGLHQSTRYADHLQYYDYEDLQGFSNGFTGNMASLGVLFMLLFLVAFYRNRTLQWKWTSLIIFIVLMQGEYYMDYPLFLMLPFITFFNSRFYKNGANSCTLNRA